MNLKEYLKEVEECLFDMSETNKNKFILHQARILKESQREKFLDGLKNKEEKVDYKQEIADFEQWIDQIREGDIFFVGEYEWDTGGNYGEPDEFMTYGDPQGISTTISSALKVATNLLYQKDYDEALIIYDRLLSSDFLMKNEEQEEYELFSLKNLVDEGLLDVNYQEILIHWLYVFYQTKDMASKMEEFYAILSSQEGSAISLDEIFSAGPGELQGTDDFLERWISFLEDRPESAAGHLLCRASAYLGGIEQVVLVAERTGSKHPFVCLHACELLFNEHRYQECETLGLRWLEVLPRNLILRATICDLVRIASTRLKHEDVESQCIVEAFYSDSTIPRFIQLFQFPDHDEIVKEAVKYCRMLPESITRSYSTSVDEQALNHTSMKRKLMIEFFSGAFELLYSKFQRSNNFLGWSTSVEGLLIPLYILTLNIQDGFTESGEKLWQDLYSKLSLEAEDYGITTEGFHHWKKLVKINPEDERKYLDWIDQMVSKRVDAVVGGGFRHSYYKAALLLENYGELLESRGVQNGRKNTIEFYIKKYPRKRAFKEEFSH